jgi:hypothetical protein
MKNKFYNIILIALVMVGLNAQAQDRYLDEVFPAVTMTDSVVFATNIHILPVLFGGVPEPVALECDIYEPAGDTLTNRPVVILIHTGSFLPAVINGQATGSKKDSSIVNQCKRFAKKGYVAVAMDNRLGWNPTSQDQIQRTSTLLQAAYRGIQDAKAMVRYLRKTVAEDANPYGIDDTKIVLGGQGTGAYISLTYDALDDPNELNLPKFLDLTDPASPMPFVIPAIYGNIDGTDSTYAPIFDTDTASPTYGQIIASIPFNLPNNASYSNDISMAFNMGGAIADISWLEAGGIPIVSFHCANDPYAPIDTGDVIVPTTGDFVVEVQGSRTVQIMQNMYNNNPYGGWDFINDDVTTAANNNNDGNDGLFVFHTPTPDTTLSPIGLPYEWASSPWDWWDNAAYDAMSVALGITPAAGIAGINATLGNPGMSASLGNLYLDTIQDYLCPRMYLTLGLGTALSINDLISKTTEIYPNPAKEYINIASYLEKIDNVKIYNISGQTVFNKNTNANTININTSNLAKGVYIVDIKANNSKTSKKIIIE